MRNWPWNYSWQSLIFSHWGWGRKSFGCLQKGMRDCSSLGALPEKIRLDGFVIRYWYTTVHAFYLWAFQTALCHDRPNDKLALLQGMDGTWPDLNFDQLRMKGGLLVSLEVRQSKILRLVLHNDGVRPIRRKPVLNPRYSGKLPAEVCLEPGETITCENTRKTALTSSQLDVPERDLGGRARCIQCDNVIPSQARDLCPDFSGPTRSRPYREHRNCGAGP